MSEIIMDEEAASRLRHEDYYRYAYAHKPAWRHIRRDERNMTAGPVPIRLKTMQLTNGPSSYWTTWFKEHVHERS